MFHRFYPKKEYHSTYSIPFALYFKKGYRGILFDIDNTLVEHDEPVTERAIMLFQRLHDLGFETCLISNNKKERIEPLAQTLQTVFIEKAGKPQKKGYQAGMKQMNTDVTNTLFVGDQIFTDIWGANRSGIHSLLVHPIAKHEEIQIIWKRKLERVVLFFYHAYLQRRKIKKSMDKQAIIK